MRSKDHIWNDRHFSLITVSADVLVVEVLADKVELDETLVEARAAKFPASVESISVSRVQNSFVEIPLGQEIKCLSYAESFCWDSIRIVSFQHTPAECQSETWWVPLLLDLINFPVVILWSLHTAHCTFYTGHLALDTVHCTMCCVKCTVHCTEYQQTGHWRSHSW